MAELSLEHALRAELDVFHAESTVRDQANVLRSQENPAWRAQRRSWLTLPAQEPLPVSAGH
jgi:hypothetical protein